MKQRYAIILTLIALFVVIASSNTDAQNARMNNAESDLELIRQGIYADLAVNEHEHTPVVTVHVVNTNEYGFYGQKLPEDAHDVLSVAGRVWANQLLYFHPTNLFCGPIELRDSNGNQLPSIQADTVSNSAYPADFSFKYAKEHNPHPTMFFPIPLINSPDRLATFSLTNYFDIKDPGEYKLTVWPKIYKRASTNDDLCQRIDLAPVTIPIEITSSQIK